jgi:hypothetical protein
LPKHVRALEKKMINGLARVREVEVNGQITMTIKALCRGQERHSNILFIEIHRVKEKKSELTRLRGAAGCWL